jgi:hypothetical protein
VNALCVPSGQQTHGCFFRFLQSLLLTHARPTLQRRGRSTAAPADDVSTGAV